MKVFATYSGVTFLVAVDPSCRVRDLKTAILDVFAESFTDETSTSPTSLRPPPTRCLLTLDGDVVLPLTATVSSLITDGQKVHLKSDDEVLRRADPSSSIAPSTASVPPRLAATAPDGSDLTSLAHSALSWQRALSSSLVKLPPASFPSLSFHVSTLLPQVPSDSAICSNVVQLAVRALTLSASPLSSAAPDAAAVEEVLSRQPLACALLVEVSHLLSSSSSSTSQLSLLSRGLCDVARSYREHAPSLSSFLKLSSSLLSNPGVLATFASLVSSSSSSESALEALHILSGSDISTTLPSPAEARFGRTPPLPGILSCIGMLVRPSDGAGTSIVSVKPQVVGLRLLLQLCEQVFSPPTTARAAPSSSSNTLGSSSSLPAAALSRPLPPSFSASSNSLLSLSYEYSRLDFLSHLRSSRLLPLLLSHGVSLLRSRALDFVATHKARKAVALSFKRKRMKRLQRIEGSRGHNRFVPDGEEEEGFGQGESGRVGLDDDFDENFIYDEEGERKMLENFRSPLIYDRAGGWNAGGRGRDDYESDSEVEFDSDEEDDSNGARVAVAEDKFIRLHGRSMIPNLVPAGPFAASRRGETEDENRDPMKVEAMIDEQLLLMSRICGRIASSDGGGGLGRRLLFDCDPSAKRKTSGGGRRVDDEKHDDDEDGKDAEQDDERGGALAFLCDLAGHPRLFGEFDIDRAIVCRRLGRSWGKITGLEPDGKGSSMYAREAFSYKFRRERREDETKDEIEAWDGDASESENDSDSDFGVSSFELPKKEKDSAFLHHPRHSLIAQARASASSALSHVVAGSSTGYGTFSKAYLDVHDCIALMRVGGIGSAVVGIGRLAWLLADEDGEDHAEHRRDGWGVSTLRRVWDWDMSSEGSRYNDEDDAAAREEEDHVKILIVKEVLRCALYLGGQARLAALNLLGSTISLSISGGSLIMGLGGCGAIATILLAAMEGSVGEERMYDEALKLRCIRRDGRRKRGGSMDATPFSDGREFLGGDATVLQAIRRACCRTFANICSTGGEDFGDAIRIELGSVGIRDAKATDDVMAQTYLEICFNVDGPEEEGKR